MGKAQATPPVAGRNAQAVETAGKVHGAAGPASGAAAAAAPHL
jgi:hypothetical protein